MSIKWTVEEEGSALGIAVSIWVFYRHVPIKWLEEPQRLGMV